MDEMLHHVKSVVRGTRRAHVVADMPFMSYQAGQDEAIRNAGRFLKEGGAQSVKVEGGRQIAGTVQRMVETGIPVMGHIGLTPQFINQMGGYKVQGKSSKDAIKLMEDARALEEAGAYSIVLELIPAQLSRLITDRVAIPTIGIGAGPHCDGQVQVFHDLMGLFPDFHPKHAGKYADLAGSITSAVAQYVKDVGEQAFPTDAQSFSMDDSVLEELSGEPAIDRP
jgi:3-methyl-2-oxobutanoate hydroxymethyltransferase